MQHRGKKDSQMWKNSATLSTERVSWITVRAWDKEAEGLKRPTKALPGNGPKI